jgi:hypothetical protein
LSNGITGHVYWRLGKLITPKEFAPAADTLKKAALAHGLKIDPQCTSNVCCLLRVPGTWNFKYATDDVPAKPVTLIYGDEKTEQGETQYDRGQSRQGWGRQFWRVHRG